MLHSGDWFNGRTELRPIDSLSIPGPAGDIGSAAAVDPAGIRWEFRSLGQEYPSCTNLET